MAHELGLFKKHGLDVRINTGPSGSAMVSFLINGQIESAFGSEIAGVSNHNLDPNVVVVAISLSYLVYYGGLSLYLTWRRRAVA